MAVIEFISRRYFAEEISGPENTFYQGAPVHDLYYLCMSACSKFALEIIKGTELMKPLYDKKHYLVVGVAGTRAGAFELTRRIVDDFISSGCEFDSFKDYLQRFWEHTYAD